MSRMRLLICAALTAAALVLAACGGSDDDAAKPLTRAEFISKTDMQCKVSNTRTRALNEELQRVAAGARNDKQLLSRLAPILDRGYGPVRDNAAAFQAANPPPADAAKIEHIRKAYDRQAELVRKLAAAAQRGDVKAFMLLSTHQRIIVTRARRLARGYGFKECGSAKSDAA
jgi:ABC-type glycerol-3-phosphate transport system substrate-binding protein